MKKLIPFALLSLLFILFSCSNDKDDPIIDDSPITISYSVGNQGLSPIFNADITYRDEKGIDVTVTGAALPWKKEITAKLPFKASLSGKYTLAPGVVVPATVTVGRDYGVDGPETYLHFQNSNTLSSAALAAWLVDSRSEFTLSNDFEK